MATARITVGALLDTVTTAATTANATLNSVSKTVGMLNAYVEEAALNQQSRIIADREDFLDNLIKEKAQEKAIADLSVIDFCKRSSDHARLYEQAYNRYSAILKPQSTNGKVHSIAAE